jgi:choline dehydrogenase-like flavoprotein
MFAQAGKEIIISGGTIETPKLLMLSGIGPAKHLSGIGVYFGLFNHFPPS